MTENLSMDVVLAFGELISSNNFATILGHGISLVNYFSNLGNYEQGIPIKNTIDFVWGTNAGIRTFPILFGLSLLQTLFSSKWIDVYLLISLILPFYTFLLAHQIIKKVDLFTLLGAFFYVGNAWIISRIFTGFWQLNIVYAFLPFLISIPIAISTNHKTNIYQKLFFVVCYSLSASIVLVAQPHFLIMTSLFSFIHIISVLISKDFVVLKRIFLFYWSSLILFILISLYFLIPGIFYSERIFTAPNQYFSLASVAFNGQGAQIENILRMVAEFPFKSFTWTWREYIQLLPLCFVSILFLINQKRRWIYAICLLTFLFLAKGLNEPGKVISEWLYENLLFLHFFRDPSRFIGGIALFGAFIIADFEIKKRLSILWKCSFVVFFVCILLLVNVKVIDEKKIILFEETKIPKAYLHLQAFIKEHAEESERVLVLPNAHGMSGYSWYKNPSIANANTTFDMLTPLAMPLANSSNYPDNYSNQLSAFLYQEFSKTYDEKLLKPLNIRYIIVDESITKPQAEKDIATQSANILSQNTKSYQRVFSEKPLSIYKVKTTAPIFTDQKPIFAIGNFATIQKSYMDGSTRPVILLNQPINSHLTNNSYLKNHELLIDIKNPVLTLAAESLAEDYSVNVLEAAWNYDKIFVNTEPYKMTYILQEGQLFTSGKSVGAQNKTGFMHVQYQTMPGKYRVLVKALTQSNASQMKIEVDDRNKTVPINTMDKLIWIDVGTIETKQDQSFITITKNDIHPLVLDYLLLIPENIWHNRKTEINKIVSSMKPYKKANVQQSDPISSEIISPDTVLVDKPTEYFTFNISYGEHWTSDQNAEKFISNGYGMTFIAKSNGIKKITYTPNQIFIVTSIISAILITLCWLFICVFLFRNTWKRIFNKLQAKVGSRIPRK